MIKEDYVSFETAKLLKERGFNADAEHDIWYVVEKFSTGCHWNSCTYKVGDITREYDEKCCIVMPTLQMAMKWIREQGFYINVDIDVDYDEDERGTKWYHKPAWDWAVFRIDERKQMSDDGALYATYEQAAEAAIKWCLENLF